jgi:acetyl-CoA carboxylase beta subunit
MWLFTKYGFYSIVQDEKDKSIFKVRARKKADLQELQSNVPEVSDCSIHQDLKADYRFRIFINSNQFQSLMLHLSNSLDYNNFKDSIYRNESQKDKLDCYHQVWDVMYEYQT